MTKFKVGDRVKKVNGDSFSNDDMEVTIKEVKEGYVWLGETGSWIGNIEIELVGAKSPIREVTRKELVAGVYGKLNVLPPSFDKKEIAIDLIKKGGFTIFSAQELRDAARVFTEIAEYLEEKK